LGVFLGANISESVGNVVLLVWLLILGYYFFYKQQWMSLYSSSRRTQEISVNGARPELSVILTQAGGKKIQVIKVVRELTGLGLKEAMDLVDGAPNAVKRNVSKDEAAQIKAKLEAEGAVVEVR
jgi:ribosomal protein L7/L12